MSVLTVIDERQKPTKGIGVQELSEGRGMIQELGGEERRVIREAAREFKVARVLPIASKLEPEKGRIRRELIDEIAGTDYFGILIPEEYRDLGLGAYEHWIFKGTSENSDANHHRCAARQRGSAMSDRTGARHGGFRG
jgi:alkylation response protein AidB-like acyl-CoA dehydrogenase